MGDANFLLIPLWWVALIALHESAHATVGKILGFKIISIEIGCGRPLVETRLLGTRVRLKRMPFGGETMFAPRTFDWLRVRLWLATLAGPGSHMVVLGLIYCLTGWAPIRDELGNLWIHDQPSVLGIVFSMNAWFLLANLLPFRYRWSSRYAVRRTDGYQLARIPFLDETGISQLKAAYDVIEAIELIDSHRAEDAIRHCRNALSSNPENSNALALMAIAHMRLGQWREAREIEVGLLQGESTYPRDEIKNGIAWIDLFLNDAALLDEANAYSKEALGGSPKKLHFKGTRGAVLVCLGNVDEGIELLRSAYSRHTYPHSRACAAYWLAIAEARRRNYEKANRWIHSARREYPNHEMAEMADAEVERSRASQADLQSPGVLV